ncbi:MAG: hypothetical protein DRQ88_12740 [Epsilonproteobacteria bacterium]|nr:MAG: hypothetical protein DRQ88_12740 [Campylobacterota bacterium]
MADKPIEYIAGGVAEGMTLEDIAKKHGVDISIINKQIKMGIEVEHEHSPDDGVAEEISKDHLFESPFYYSYLEEMEEELEEHLEEDIKRGMTEEEEEKKKPKKKATMAQVIEFLKLNPNPKDDDVHEWAKENGFEIHGLEALFYKLASDHVKAMEKEKKDSMDSEELKNDTIKRLFG